jgi:Holliday junction resolvase-like predicted endonuclease
MLAERRVALQYEQRGFVVLDRNWRCGVGELDIVSANSSTLAVIEVKWRQSSEFGGAAGAVGRSSSPESKRRPNCGLYVTRRGLSEMISQFASMLQQLLAE